MGLLDTLGGWANQVGGALQGVTGFLGENLEEIASIGTALSGLKGTGPAPATTGPPSSAKNKPGSKPKGSSFGAAQASGGLQAGTLLIFVGALAVVVLIARR